MIAGSRGLEGAAREIAAFLGDDPASVERRLESAAAGSPEATEPIVRGMAEALRPERSLYTEKVLSVLRAAGAVTVLDLGGPLGIEAIALAQAGLAVTYRDGDGPTSAFTRWRIESRDLPIHLAASFDGLGSFDAVVAVGALEAARDPVSLIAAITKCIRPGGWLLVSADDSAPQARSGFRTVAKTLRPRIEAQGFRLSERGGPGRRLLVFRRRPAQRWLAPLRGAARFFTLDRVAGMVLVGMRERRQARAVRRLGTEHVPCYLCGADAPRVLGRKDGLPLVRCTRCGFVYVTPRLTAEGLRRFYGAAYWSAERRRVGEHALDERTEFDDRLAAERVRAIARHKAAGRLLDVGCAGGAFLRQAAAAGYEAEGIELDPEVAARAARATGRPVHAGALRAQGFPSGRFDVATLYDVIEHLPDPIAELREVRRLLAPDGLLVLETVRVNDNAAFERNPVAWPDTRPLEHIYLFSEETLDQVLDRAGFESIARERPDPRYGHRTLRYCRPSRD